MKKSEKINNNSSSKFSYVFLFLLVFSISTSFCLSSFTQVLVSNATYGEKIYVLIYNESSYVESSVHAISPSGKVTSAKLAAGQAVFDANEIGQWDIYFDGKLYPAYVSDSSAIQNKPVKTTNDGFDFVVQLLKDAVSFPAFILFLILILGGSILFLYFFMNSYSPYQFEVKKSVSNGMVTIKVKNNGNDADKILLLDFFEDGNKLLCIQKIIGRIDSGKSAELSYPAGKNSKKYHAKSALLANEDVEEIFHSGRHRA